jgi:asparagine synthase (glutamine-hydrolysing)
LKNVRKLTPGCFLSVKNGTVAEKSYWSVNLEKVRRPLPSMEEASRELLMLLEDSVRLQMVSDVPLGGFLSGGVDSSLVAALMAKHASGRVQTFSIGFEKGTGVDESAYARQVARFIGTEHHEMILSEKDLSSGEKVFSRMNEPVADPTVLPTAILSEFARKSVTVALTGEGGDELFAGYNRYKSVVYASWVQKFPTALRPAASWIFRRAGRGESFRAIPDVSASNWFNLNRDFPSERLGRFLNPSLRGLWSSYLPGRIVPVLQNPGPDALNAVLEIERQTSLTDRLLMKVDMASMCHSLEARPPYLDHRIVEFAFSLPAEFKVRRFKGKYVLRTAAAKLLPSNIAWRRKHGFIVPLSKWLGAHSEDWVRSVLGSPALEAAGVFEKSAIQAELDKAYRQKEGDSLAVLWPMIVIGAWLESLK